MKRYLKIDWKHCCEHCEDDLYHREEGEDNHEFPCMECPEEDE